MLAQEVKTKYRIKLKPNSDQHFQQHILIARIIVSDVRKFDTRPKFQGKLLSSDNLVPRYARSRQLENAAGVERARWKQRFTSAFHRVLIAFQLPTSGIFQLKTVIEQSVARHATGCVAWVSREQHCRQARGRWTGPPVCSLFSPLYDTCSAFSCFNYLTSVTSARSSHKLRVFVPVSPIFPAPRCRLNNRLLTREHARD